MFRKVVGGVFHLHKVNQIAHGDLKLENIVISDDIQSLVKLIDFGLSTNSEQLVYHKCGTEEYLPLEVRVCEDQ